MATLATPEAGWREKEGERSMLLQKYRKQDRYDHWCLISIFP
jgi:hypothetical protein